MNWWRRNKKTDSESMFDHHVCKVCSKSGHRIDMTTIPDHAWRDWLDATLRAQYGKGIDLGDPRFCDLDKWIYVHKDCAPLQHRPLFGGWELTEAGKKTLKRKAATKETQ